MRLGQLLESIGEEIDVDSFDLPGKNWGCVLFDLSSLDSRISEFAPVCYQGKYIWWWDANKNEKVVNVHSESSITTLIEDLKIANMHTNFDNGEWQKIHGYGSRTFNL